MDYAILDKINELSDKLDHNKSVRWLTISDVCDYLHLSQSTIRRKIQSGEIKCSRKFGKILVDSAWLERWLKMMWSKPYCTFAVWCINEGKVQNCNILHPLLLHRR